jgi:histidine triad (HIT) family protein
MYLPRGGGRAAFADLGAERPQADNRAMPAPCVFCAIAAGEQAASVVFRDQRLCAFLDVRPVFHGHVLIVPRAHIADFAELPAELAGPILQLGQRIAAGQQKALAAEGAFVALNHRVSQSVPHVHLHVVPRKKKDGLRGFFWPRTTYASDAERDAVAARLREALPP